MTAEAPVLVAAAHGTSSPAGRSAIGGLVAAVAA
ncbi:MAG: cobalamin biosynthesis protein CbiX, partial [Dermatophilaceae bacterium]|nr:cobalamin biosynthesis protein CbiX [Dermatophilaceae bacterium]